MKSLSFAILGLAFLATTSRADDKKDVPTESAIKVVVTHLEEAWGTKVKSVNIKDEGGKSRYTLIKLTLEFSKDIPDLEGLKKTFAIPKTQQNPVIQAETLPLVFHLCDAENVSLGKYHIVQMEGDLSGVKGDAFRILLSPDVEVFKRSAKLEARLKAAAKVDKKD